MNFSKQQSKVKGMFQLSINAKALERGFWDNVSFKDKTGELLAIATNMNWSFAELAEQVGISEVRLDGLITLEEVDDELSLMHY